MQRTPRPPGSSQPHTNTSRGVARGSLAISSLHGLITSLTSRFRGADASRAASPTEYKGVQTNLTVNASAGILVGSWQCRRSSVPPVTGAQDGSRREGPSGGHRVIQSTMEPKSAMVCALRFASKSSLNSFKPLCMLFFLTFPDVFCRGLAVLSRSSAVGAAWRSGVHVKPPSMETRSWTAAEVMFISTTDPRGDWATSGVVNSIVSTSTILAATTTSNIGETDLSLTFAGMVSCTKGRVSVSANW
mmetsp:Transcript_54456/g.137505  ORF Transcript_54456/g.137505 Transcript_54456/m.137505 type:complete len:246 (-) Transcript_54456:1378-2115(-)